MKKKQPNRQTTRSTRKLRSKATTSTSRVATDYWERLSPVWQYGIVLVFLITVFASVFPEVFLGSQRYVAHDIQQFQATARSVIEYREETGEQALWATNIFSGMPSYTVISTKAVTHIDTLLRQTFPALFIPVIPLLIAAAGSMFLFWLMGFGALPAALAALGITLTTYIPVIIGAGHNAKFIAYSYIPWVIAGYYMLSRSQRKLAGLFLFAMALTFTLRAEHVQVIYYFLFLLAIWFACDLGNAWRKGALRSWLPRAALMILGGLLALGANIQPYWSIHEYSAYSIRGGSEIAEQPTGGLDTDYAFAWSQGRGELLTLIIPGIYGGSSGEGTYWGPKTFTSGPHYLGAIVFLLFLVALFRVHTRLKWVFLGAGTLAMLFSLGKHLYGFNMLFFHYMPFFNKFRTPEMWLIVTAVCVAVMAAMGMKWIADNARNGTLALSGLYLPVGVALGSGLLILLLQATTFSFEKADERSNFARQVATQNQMAPDDPQVVQFVNRYIEQELMPQRAGKARSDSLRYVLFILLGSGLLAATALRKIPASYALAGLLVLAAIDLAQIGKRYTDKSGLVPASMQPGEAVSRMVRPMDEHIRDHMFTSEGWPMRTLPLSDNPFNNAVPAAYFYPSIGGYSGAKLSHYQDLIDEVLFTGPYGIHLGVLNMLNTGYITHTEPLRLPGWLISYEGRDGFVHQNTHELNKAFFVDSLFTTTDPREALDALGTLELSSEAVLQSEHAPPLVPTENRSATVTEYGPREIRVDVSTDAPSFLVLSEIYYPAGWLAQLNGQSIPIYRTNYVLRGMSIPEGSHELVLRFEPRSHVLGSRLSWIFHLLLLATGAGALFLERRSRSERPENTHS